MESGAQGRRFDAYPWRHLVTESSYINSLANHPCRSTVKTLPTTLPEPWTTVRGPSSKQIGPWSTDLEPRIGDSVSRLKLRGSRLAGAEPGLLGLVAGYGSIWVEGGLGSGWLCLGPRAVMERWRRRNVILFVCAAKFKSCPRKLK